MFFNVWILFLGKNWIFFIQTKVFDWTPFLQLKTPLFPLPSDYFVCLAYVLICTFYVVCCLFVFAICQNTPNPFPAPTYPGGGPLPWTPHRFQTNKLKRKTDNPTYILGEGHGQRIHFPQDYCRSNISHCHQGIFPAATKEYFPLPPPNISHCYHGTFSAVTKENSTVLSQSRGFFPFHIPLTWPPFVTLGANDWILLFGKVHHIHHIYSVVWYRAEDQGLEIEATGINLRPPGHV